MDLEKITTVKDVLWRVGAPSLRDLEESSACQTRLVEIAAAITPAVWKELVDLVPSLAEAFGKYVTSVADVSKSCDSADKARWETLREVAKSRVLTGEQVMEAIELLVRLREADLASKSHTEGRIVDSALAVGTAIAAAIAFGIGYLIGRDSQR